MGETVDSAMREGSTDVLVIEGEGGKAFCAGADLASFAEAIRKDQAKEVVGRVAGAMNEVILAIVEGGKPVVACVNGVAVGGGFGLALACDVRVMGEGARFVPGFLGAGVSPDAGSTWLLPRMVGWARAREILLLGEELDARSARAVGLATRVVGDGVVREEALALARGLGGQPSEAVSSLKARLLEPQASLREQLEAERRSTVESAGSEAFRERVLGFVGDES